MSKLAIIATVVCQFLALATARAQDVTQAERAYWSYGSQVLNRLCNFDFPALNHALVSTNVREPDGIISNAGIGLEDRTEVEFRGCLSDALKLVNDTRSRLDFATKERVQNRISLLLEQLNTRATAENRARLNLSMQYFSTAETANQDNGMASAGR